jgi:hypothetical protein
VTARLLGFFAVLAVALHPSPLLAQTSSRDGRLEIAGGVQWIGPVTFTSVSADETTPGGGTRSLFDTSTRLDPSVGVAVTVGFRLPQAVQVQANVAYGATHLTTRVTGDREGIPDASVESSVTQYLLGGDLLLQPARWRVRRLAPFAVVGGAYVRQLSEGRTLVQTGAAYSAGGGFYYGRNLSGGRRMKSAGVRLDVRALALHDGVVFDGRIHVAPSIAAAVFAGF